MVAGTVFSSNFKDADDDEFKVRLVDYEQLTDPDSFYFDPNWYLNYEVPDSDPWFEVYWTFGHAKYLIDFLVQKYGYKWTNSIGVRKSKSKAKRDLIENAFYHLSTIHPLIEDHLSARKSNLKFSLLWGEYKDHIRTIDEKHPELRKAQSFANLGRELETDEQKQWYTLWCHHYKEQKGFGRDRANNQLNKLISEVLKRERKLPYQKTVSEFKGFIRHMASDDSDLQKGHFTLSNGYSKGKLWGEKFKGYFEKAQQNKNLPFPFGEDHYPIK